MCDLPVTFQVTQIRALEDAAVLSGVCGASVASLLDSVWTHHLISLPHAQGGLVGGFNEVKLSCTCRAHTHGGGGPVCRSYHCRATISG